MTDHYDEMSVPPDPSQAEALRQRLHARMASVAQDDHHGRPLLRLDVDHLDPDELDPSKEIYVSLDSPASETGNRRRLLMTAAAVVVVVGIAGIAFANNSTDDDQTPAPPAAATVAPTTTVVPAMQTVRFAVTSANIPMTFTVPGDWTLDGGSAAHKGSGVGEVGLHVDEIPNLYADGCQWVPLDPPVGPSVEDLVAAWANLPDYAATAAVGVTVDGHAGKQIEFTVPDYNIGECKGADSPAFGLWTQSDSIFPGFEAQGPKQHTQQRILDVDGTRLVITAYDVPSTSPQDRAALDAALASIQIDSEVISPLETVGGSLTSGADVELFRVTADEPAYWRLITLAAFDGRTWRLPDSDLSLIDDTADSPPDGRTNRQQLQILALQGQLLPAAADPTQVAPSTNIRFNADSSTILTTGERASGDQFTIVSEAPDVTLDELRAATTDNPPDDVFLELPDNVPGVVSDLATEVTAAATTDADKMVALQNWFRNEFTYDLTVSAGHGDDAIEMFLETRRGFCEHFSSTFAVMARTLGIPSRVAVGFTPGTRNADGSYSVFGKNSHAWPEIWFDGIGWIPFEPTPQRAIPGAEDYTGVEAD